MSKVLACCGVIGDVEVRFGIVLMLVTALEIVPIPITGPLPLYVVLF